MIKVPVSLTQTSSKEYGPQEPVSKSWQPCWLSDGFKLLPIRFHYLPKDLGYVGGLCPGLPRSSSLVGTQRFSAWESCGRTVNPRLQLDPTKKTLALRHCGINSSCSIDCQFNTPNNCNRVEIRFLATLPAAKICVHPLKQTLFLSWNLLRGTVLPWSWVINQDQEVAY
jgi:hypothetical protein